MDRLDAMRAFIAALDEGSLAAAGRRLGRSPPAMTRAIASLEAQIGMRLFERRTRLVRLTEAGERTAIVARRILAELDELNLLAAGETAQPRGVLTVTAPVVAGGDILRPCLDDYLDAHPQVRARLMLLDRLVNLGEEGIDVALRIGHLADSAMVAMRVGSVRRVVCAAPAYLKRHGAIREPGDLSKHRIVSLAETRQAENWSFAPRAAGGGARIVRLAPRLLVNTIAAARGSALAGKGVARLLSYQVADDVRAGRLAILLEKFEPAEMPVHLVAPRDRLAMPKTRAFVDFALPRLKAAFAAKTMA
jgi:DNA-binding transcriptional LysR family regulator